MAERRPAPLRTEAPRRIDQPEPGFFLVRLVRGGPEVPAVIRYGPTRDPLTGEPLDRSWYWSVEINGRLVAEPAIDPVEAGVFRVWLSGRRIDAAEYRYRLARAVHAQRWRPDAPEANPHRPVDRNAMRPIFGGRN